jgi:8-oxo-dGTP pyrophosphatase MutT (NUDIX family)
MLQTGRMAVNFQPAPTLTHAGGVVYRLGHGVHTILLVTARRPPHDWVLPKGRIEPQETPAEAARREVGEEAGVDALPEQYLGDIGYRSPKGETLQVGYFLMRFNGEVASQENRDIRWCTLDEARQLIPFDSTRSIIQSAEEALSNPVR